mmetsp:Transcript_11595/g.22821  ORF Transcript_11595/g.22821 Transcript_11595/m.22821 type:complete len:129 (+) Transcript_11595:384-770(+)
MSEEAKKVRRLILGCRDSEKKHLRERKLDVLSAMKDTHSTKLPTHLQKRLSVKCGIRNSRHTNSLFFFVIAVFTGALRFHLNFAELSINTNQHATCGVLHQLLLLQSKCIVSPSGGSAHIEVHIDSRA